MTTLTHTYDTWGNYGQHSGCTDYVLLDDTWYRCDDLPGATVTDSSAHSRKNRHDNIEVEVELEPGTLGRTDKSSASSSNASESVEYWTIDEAGEKQPVTHKRAKENGEYATLTVDTLAGGERIVVARAPKGVRLNSYAGTCCDCRKSVAPGQGELFKDGGWKTRCCDCFVKKAERQLAN